MKKALFIFLFHCTASLVIYGQSATTGRVTDPEGIPVPNASITIAGTKTGTITNEKGEFSISVLKNQKLAVSAIGYNAIEFSPGENLVIQLTHSNDGLAEVVVTALGVRRGRKSITYSAQAIDGEKLTISRETNIASAIAGKVAGVQVVGAPSVGFGVPNIRIRGVNTLDGGNVRDDLNPNNVSPVGALYVLDGTPVDARAINMDNIETISVLKGAAATALYGQRAAGGVVLVTSKKGKKNMKPAVELNSAFTVERIGLLPKYQNEYAGGYSGDFLQFSYDPARHPASWAAFDGQNYLEYYADESWGPKMDGREYRPYWSWFPGDDFGKTEPLLPRPDNVKDFFETGLTFNNNVSVTGGGDSYTYRLTYNNINRTTPLPNSAQNRNFLTLATTLDITRKLTVISNINFQTTAQTGNFLEGYGAGITGSFNQWFQRQIDTRRLKNYKNPDGTFNSWNILGPDDYTPDDPSYFLKPLYWNNPYYDVYENTPRLRSNRLYGDIGLKYEIINGLTVTGTVRGDIYRENTNGRVTEGGLNQPAYNEGAVSANEYNFEGIVGYRKKFGEFDLDANAGGNMLRIQRLVYNGNTVGGLAIPGFYSLASSKDRPFAKTDLIQLRRNSLFARASIGWRNMLYLDLSGRNDWSSALPLNNNSYFYPSAGLSFVFSELTKSVPAISYGKLRASIGQVGRDLNPYNIYDFYQAGNPYGADATLFTPNNQPNANLKPNLQTSYEAGLEMRFLKSRLGFDFTYYKNVNTNQILPIQVSQSSGIVSSFINAGRIESQGIELIMDGSPVRSRNFDWTITLNFAINRNKVVELMEGDGDESNFILGNATTFRRAIQLQAREGQPWGQIVGTRYRTDDKTGMPLLAANANWLVDENQVIKNALPDFTGGIQNAFRWKRLTLGVNIDYQKGGSFYSVTRMFNAYSGLGAETVGTNGKGNPMRDAVADGGGLLPAGILPNGEQNTNYVAAVTYFGRLFDLHERWIYDASFIKLREISIGYTFDPKIFGSKSLIRGLSLSLIARNVALLYSNVDGIDPSELEVYWHEGGQLPATRSYGINARFTF